MEDEKFMFRCLQLAQNGFGTTYPNPLVGSVIVHQGKIIGQGFHFRSGEAHAEVQAIKSVKKPELLPQSTLYVNLEPCSHFGKTPPCADLILQKKIKKVVIGTTDPFSKVAGRGIQKLRENGCEVVVGVLQEKCAELNARFFTFHQQKRPYIILKWAQTSDGFIAPETQKKQAPFWISNEFSQQISHSWRANEQAILAGTTTILKDNPSLTTRKWAGSSPLRVIIDKDLKISETHNVFNAEASLLILTEKEKKSSLENVDYQQVDFSKSLPRQILEILYRKGIQSLIVEGGTNVIQQFINEDLWDTTRVFVSENELFKGVVAPKFFEEFSQKYFIDKDVLTIYQNFKIKNERHL